PWGGTHLLLWQSRDDLDLHHHPFDRQACNLDHRGRGRIHRMDVLGAHLAEWPLVGLDVEQEDVHLDNVIEGSAGLFQALLEVLECGTRLGIKVPCADQVVLGIHGTLTRYVDQRAGIVYPYDLAEAQTSRLERARRTDELAVHGSPNPSA